MCVLFPFLDSFKGLWERGVREGVGGRIFEVLLMCCNEPEMRGGGNYAQTPAVLCVGSKSLSPLPSQNADRKRKEQGEYF